MRETEAARAAVATESVAVERAGAASVAEVRVVATEVAVAAAEVSPQAPLVGTTEVAGRVAEAAAKEEVVRVVAVLVEAAWVEAASAVEVSEKMTVVEVRVALMEAEAAEPEVPRATGTEAGWVAAAVEVVGQVQAERARVAVSVPR